MHVYGEALRAFLLDQLQWIRDRDHVRRVNERHGRDALALAATADRLAIAENAPLPKLLPLSGHWACETGPGS
jgi:hypothetical protein